MSLNKSEQSLHIEPKRSRQLAFLLLMLHGLAMVVIVNLAMDAWVTAAVAIGIIGFMVTTWHIYVSGTSKKSIKVLVWDADGQWTVITENRKSHKAELLPSTYVYPHIIVLQFLGDNRQKYSTIIMPDSIGDNLYRRLLVRLRHSNT